MKLFVISFAVTAMLVGLVLELTHPVGSYQYETPQIQRVHEDSPEWDCATMGNRVCGSERE